MLLVLSFLISGHELFIAIFQMMKTNLRGELTLYKDDEMHQFSLRDNELIDAVASHFKVGSTEVRVIKHNILLCSDLFDCVEKLIVLITLKQL